MILHMIKSSSNQDVDECPILGRAARETCRDKPLCFDNTSNSTLDLPNIRGLLSMSTFSGNLLVSSC